MDQNKENLAKLEGILKILDSGVTKAEFVAALEKVIEIILAIEKRTTDAVSGLEETYQAVLDRVKNDHTSTLSDLKKQVNVLFVEKQVTKIKEELTAVIQKKLESVKDGAPGPKGDTVNGKDGRDGKDGSPDSPRVIKQKLELLTGDERLDASAIKGLEKGTGGLQLVGGGRGIALYVNGVKKGSVKTLNLIGGTGITLTYTLSNGRNDILIDNTSTSLTKLTATGSVNSTNAAFTFVSKPVYIISDGAWYQENKGWTWNSGTLTATMTIPPNDDIYGFS